MAKKTDYRNLRSELDQLVLELQDSALDIDLAVQKYKRSLAIITELETYIDSVQNTIGKVKPQKKA